MGSPSNSYSIDGYLMALRMRGEPTLLVEGITDRKAVARVVIALEEVQEAPIGPITIDTVDLINGHNVALDGRQLVEHIHTKAVSEGLPLFALVDREFRGFDIGPPIIDRLCEHNVIDNSLFWTRGHSIENYFLDEKHIIACLKFLFPESIPSSAYHRLIEAIPDLHAWGASISLAALSNNMIKRSQRLFKVDNWIIGTTGKFELELSRLKVRLMGRNISEQAAQSFIDAVVTYYSLCNSQGDATLNRWILHGHLGKEVIWTGVGKLLSQFGLGPAQIDSVCYGYTEEKLRKSAELWAGEIIAGTTISPIRLWDRLRSLNSERSDVSDFIPPTT